MQFWKSVQMEFHLDDWYDFRDVFHAISGMKVDVAIYATEFLGMK